MRFADHAPNPNLDPKNRKVDDTDVESFVQDGARTAVAVEWRGHKRRVEPALLTKAIGPCERGTLDIESLHRLATDTNGTPDSSLQVAALRSVAHLCVVWARDRRRDFAGQAALWQVHHLLHCGFPHSEPHGRDPFRDVHRNSLCDFGRRHRYGVRDFDPDTDLDGPCVRSPPAIYRFAGRARQLARLAQIGWFDTILISVWFWNEPSPSFAELTLPLLRAHAPRERPRPFIGLLVDDAHAVRASRLAQWETEPAAKRRYEE